MRADVNVSVRKPGGELGTRTETKNVNSVRFVMAVVEHEAKRQVELLEGGGAIAQETRLYDPDKGVTRSLRSKEDAHDYRYFPDPDLLPLELDEAFLAECKASLPELPDAKRKRYEAHGITPYNASVLTAEVETARWFDALLEAGAEPKQAAQLGRRRAVRSAQPARRDDRQEPGCAGRRQPSCSASSPTARSAGPSPSRCSKSCSKAARAPARSSRAAASSRPATPARSTPRSTKSSPPTPTRSSEYKAGKQALFGFFVGQTMKAMAGKANPQVVNERLRAKLGG